MNTSNSIVFINLFILQRTVVKTFAEWTFLRTRGASPIIEIIPGDAFTATGSTVASRTTMRT